MTKSTRTKNTYHPRAEETYRLLVRFPKSWEQQLKEYTKAAGYKSVNMMLRDVLQKELDLIS